MITFPLNYRKTKNHQGKPVIKPYLPALSGWQNLTKSVPIYDHQGVGLLTGYSNNLTVLDFDNEEIHQKMISKFPELTKTLVIKTPSGYHYYFNYSDELKNSSFQSGELSGMDIKNDRGFVISIDSYQIVDGVKIPYRPFNTNKKTDLPVDVLEYILDQSLDTSSVQHNEYSETRFHFHNLSLLEEAFKKLDNGFKWRQITNAVKGLMNSENSDEIIRLWDQWSYGHPKYDHLGNLEILEKQKPAIHPNFIFKLAGMKTRIFPIPYLEPEIRFDHTFHEQYVSNGIDKLPENIKNSDYAIKSGTGSGKTYYTAKLVKQKHMNDRVYLISNRVSLSKQFKQSFKKCEFKHYQDKDMINGESMTNYLQQHQNAKLIIQINSLCKIKELTKDHILILDEVSSLLKYLVSGNISKMENVYMKFIELIRNAKQLICIDGDLDQYSIDFLNSLRTNPLTLIRNEYQNGTGISCLVTRNLNQVYQKIKEKIDQGWLTVHCTDTKSMAKNINDKLVELGVPENRIKSYHTDSKEDKNDLTDVNTHWNGYHITFSPSIVTGVDYTEDYRTVFLYVNAYGQTHGKTTINPRDMAQQIARVRKIDELIVYLDTYSYKPPFESFEDFKSNFLESIKESNEHLSPLLVDINEDTGIYLKETRFSNLLMKYKYEEMMIQSDQENYLVDRLKSKGFSVFFSIESKMKTNLMCIHPKIDDYIKILIEPTKHKEPNTVLYENIKKRVEILHFEDLDLIGIEKPVRELLACGRSFNNHLNFFRFINPKFKFEAITVLTKESDKHKISVIRSLMHKQGITIESFENPEIQLSEIKITKQDSKMFKNLFQIKNSIDYNDNLQKFTKELAKQINDLTFFCQNVRDTGNTLDHGTLFNLESKLTQIRSGQFRGKRYYPIVINRDFLDFNTKLIQLRTGTVPKIDSEYFLDSQ